jgi:hypothetical protein
LAAGLRSENLPAASVPTGTTVAYHYVRVVASHLERLSVYLASHRPRLRDVKDAQTMLDLAARADAMEREVGAITADQYEAVVRGITRAVIAVTPEPSRREYIARAMHQIAASASTSDRPIELPPISDAPVTSEYHG